jgi:hypothetical protein
VAGSFKHCNEPSGSTKSGEFLDLMSDYQLFSKDWWSRGSSVV